MNCLIIDDNAKTFEVLSALLKTNCAFDSIIAATESFQVRLAFRCKANPIHIVYIRVRMFDYTLFEELDAEQMPLIVFLSGGKERITEKEATGVRYQLREPYTDENVSRLLRTVKLNAKQEPADYLFIRFEARYHKIKFDAIELVERLMGSYVRLHTTTTKFLLPGSLASFEDRLPQDRFSRISDGLIVPEHKAHNQINNTYQYNNKQYPLTYRFLRKQASRCESMLFEGQNRKQMK